MTNYEIKIREYIKNKWGIEISDKVLYYIIHTDRISKINDQDLKAIVEEVAPIRKSIFKSLDGPYEAEQTAAFMFILEDRCNNKLEAEYHVVPH